LKWVNDSPSEYIEEFLISKIEDMFDQYYGFGDGDNYTLKDKLIW
jgi:hypothetical protein